MNVIEIGQQIFVTLSDGFYKTDTRPGLYLEILTAIKDEDELRVRSLIGDQEEDVSLAETRDNLIELGLEFRDDRFYWGSQIPLSEFMVETLREMEPDDPMIEPYRKFWAWSQLNPNPASRDMLFEHCRKYDIQITDTGMLITYRNVKVVEEVPTQKIAHIMKEYARLQQEGVTLEDLSYYFVIDDDGDFLTVTSDEFDEEGTPDNAINIYDFAHNAGDYIKDSFTDNYSGTFDYKIGHVAQMPREDCDESQKTCSRGLMCSPAA